MRSKKSLYCIIAAIGLQIMMLITNMIVPKVLLVMFGSEMNGLVTSITQFIRYLTLVEAGLAGACIYSLYKPLADKDHAAINAILSASRKFYNKSGYLFAILTLVLTTIFPIIVKDSNIKNNIITSLVLILGFNGSLEFFTMGKYRVLLTADQRAYIISIIQMIGQLINCSLIVILGLSGVNIVLVYLISSVSYIVRSLLFGYIVKRKYSYLDFNVPPNKSALNQRYDVLIHQIASIIIVNSPVLLLTIFCSLQEVSVYSIYYTVFAGVGAIIGIFNNGLMAAFGDIISRKEEKLLQITYNQYECGYYMLSTWMYSCTFLLALPFIHLYTKGITDVVYVRRELMVLFVIVGILNVLRVPQSTLVNATGHFKETKSRALLEMAINIVVSLLLVPKLGIVGVLIGTICSYMYRTLDFIIYVPRKITKLTIRRTIIRILKMCIIAILIVIPIEVCINIEITNFIEWIVYAMGVSIWAALVSLLGGIILERKTFKEIINRIRTVITSLKLSRTKIVTTTD